MAQGVIRELLEQQGQEGHERWSDQCAPCDAMAVCNALDLAPHVLMNMTNQKPVYDFTLY